MKRLSGQDAAFLYNETPDQHMHTLKVAVFSPPVAEGEAAFDRVVRNLVARLHLLPSFRRRVVPVPLQIHHPVWVEDPEFRLDRHVRHVRLPAPGGRDQFDGLLSEITGTPLDRSRPLWELWVVEGLSDGAMAFVAKIHHCMADGIMAAALLDDVLTADPAERTVRPPDEPWRPEPLPTRRRLFLDALVDLLPAVARIPALAWRSARGAVRVVRHKRASPVAVPGPFTGPRVSFNHSLTPNRRVVTTSLPLADAKQVKSTFGVTLNDVILAVCTQALRSYLVEGDELPDRPLVAGIPVSTRTPGERLRANSVSNLFTALPVHIDDPVAQLRAVHEVTKGAKHQFDLLGFDMLAEWSELTPPWPYSASIRLYGRFGLAEHHRPPINLVISNVPGPSVALYVDRARLHEVYSIGPLLEGIGLNVTVWSYLDALYVGLVATPEHAPRLDHLRNHLDDALRRLLAAADVAPGPVAVRP